jgi:protein O-GlcNAc transferase
VTYEEARSPVERAFSLFVCPLQNARDGPTGAFVVANAPTDAAGWVKLGETYLRSGRLHDGLVAFVRALSLRPDLGEAWRSVGLLLREQGEATGAAECFELALLADPQGSREHAHRAEPRRAGRRGPARPRLPTATTARLLAALGTTLVRTGPFEPAIALFRRSLELEPELAPAHANLGAALLQCARLDDAITSLRKALAIRPEDAASYLNLGSALIRAARHAEALDAFRQAIALKPGDPSFHSHLVGNLHYAPGVDAGGLLEEARAWDRCHGLPLAATITPHTNDRSPDRRLRVGYVSPDFREHAQRFFTLPLLAHHDREQFEIFGYSNVPEPDDVTLRIRSHVHHWRDLSAMDDAEAAECIREEGIDILVDLAMHTDRNRLPLFARKPAPVQVCWLAYPGVTGLSAMDYRLTDRFFDPPGADGASGPEQPVRLPDSFWCFDPLTREPEVAPLHAKKMGHVRFGCLNGFCKINEPLLELWARVLRATESSRLVVVAPPGESRERTQKSFARHGIDASRIELLGSRPRPEYLALYHDIDVALDPVPFSGGTTSLEALWMGVPVVTLVGATVAGRGGYSLAMNLGLPELVARSDDEYVAIAAGLARDLDRLAELRAGLRGRLESSPLMDVPRFARGIEAAFRDMWRRWCA